MQFNPNYFSLVFSDRILNYCYLIVLAYPVPYMRQAITFVTSYPFHTFLIMTIKPIQLNTHIKSSEEDPPRQGHDPSLLIEDEICR